MRTTEKEEERQWAGSPLVEPVELSVLGVLVEVIAYDLVTEHKQQGQRLSQKPSNFSAYNPPDCILCSAAPAVRRGIGGRVKLPVELSFEASRPFRAAEAGRSPQA